MMSGAKKRAPKRRFKEFLNAGDWEQRKLGNIVDFLDGQRKPLKESERTKGKYPYYGASGIIDYINDYLFDENLVLLSEDGANIIDRNYPVCFIATGKYWVNNHAHVLKVKTGVIDKFICESLERLDFTKFNTGTAQPKLNQDICQKIVITIPNEDEQKCISEFLDRINNIITLHQRKLDKLQATKKALLQEMFPEEGQDKPKRRFKGFTDAWEQRKLRNLLEQPITDGPHETPELYDSGIPFISVDAIVDNKIDFTKMRGYISKEYDDICAKKYKPQINDVYLVKSGATIGKVAIVETYDDFNIWSPLAAMRCGSITNPYFLYMLLQTQDLQSQVFNKASHGTQPNLSMRQLETFTCKVPKIEEQKLISRFLKQLDDVITLHQHKLDKLKNLKQAYLNEMFV